MVLHSVLDRDRSSLVLKWDQQWRLTHNVQEREIKNRIINHKVNNGFEFKNDHKFVVMKA